MGFSQLKNNSNERIVSICTPTNVNATSHFLEQPMPHLMRIVESETQEKLKKRLEREREKEKE